jgi:hypothetical protein
MIDVPTSRARQWAALCGLVVITLAAYANSFQAGFPLDNGFLVLGDTRIRQLTAANLSRIFSHTYWWPYTESGLYRPVTTLSYLFNYAILGNTNHPAGYHAINLLLHIGNVLLVFLLVRRLTKHFWISIATGMMWAVHPVLTESVTNIVGRADLLAGMTTLGGFLLYLKSAEDPANRRWIWLAALGAVTMVGVFSKESAVAVVGVVVLYELTWWKPERLRPLLLGCLAMAPAFLAMWAARAAVLGKASPAIFPFVDNPIAGAGFWTGRLTAIKVLANYLGRLVWPVHLSADYSYSQIPLVTGTLIDWISWIVIALAAAAAGFLFFRHKIAFFAAGFAFITLLPSSNLLIPVGTIMAERFLYLPAIGLALSVALALSNLRRRVYPPQFTWLPNGLAIAAAVTLLIVIAFTGRTWARNKDWHDDYTLWSATVETSPRSFKAHTALAKTLLLAQKPDGPRITEEDEAGLAILDPLPDILNDGPVYYNVGAQDVLIGDSLRRRYPDGEIRMSPDSLDMYGRARTALLRSIAIREAQAKAARQPAAPRGDETVTSAAGGRNAEVFTWLLLSQTEQRLGRAGDALRSARRAQEIGPMIPSVYQRLHDALLFTHRDDAIAAAMEGLVLTANTNLTNALIKDFVARPDNDKCALTGLSLNFECPSVHRLICSVSGDAARMALKGGGTEAESRVKNDLTKLYGCPIS